MNKKLEEILKEHRNICNSAVDAGPATYKMKFCKHGTWDCKDVVAIKEAFAAGQDDILGWDNPCMNTSCDKKAVVMIHDRERNMVTYLCYDHCQNTQRGHQEVINRLKHEKMKLNSYCEDVNANWHLWEGMITDLEYEFGIRVRAEPKAKPTDKKEKFGVK